MIVDLSFDYSTREESIVVEKKYLQIEKGPQEYFEWTIE